MKSEFSYDNLNVLSKTKNKVTRSYLTAIAIIIVMGLLLFSLSRRYAISFLLCILLALLFAEIVNQAGVMKILNEEHLDNACYYLVKTSYLNKIIKSWHYAHIERIYLIYSGVIKEKELFQQKKDHLYYLGLIIYSQINLNVIPIIQLSKMEKLPRISIKNQRDIRSQIEAVIGIYLIEDTPKEEEKLLSECSDRMSSLVLCYVFIIIYCRFDRKEKVEFYRERIKSTGAETIFWKVLSNYSYPELKEKVFENERLIEDTLPKLVEKYKSSKKDLMED